MNLNHAAGAATGWGDHRMLPFRHTGSDPRMEEQLGTYVSGLYEEHYGRLFRHLVLSGSTAAEADDLIQEGFLRLFRHLRSGEPVENPRWWLLRVIHNLRIDDIRKRKREFAMERPEFECLVGQLPSADPDAEEQILAREEQARIQTAVGKLAPRQYQYLLLRAEGFKLREIAAMFRVTVQTVSESCAKAMLELGRLGNES
jgi:RNA polymerase sigma-70 factor (ECF subfamily)